MRLHMLIFASVMNVPMAGVAYDPKVRGFMDYMHQNNYINLKEFDGEKFGEMLGEVLEKENILREELRRDLDPLREKAKKNALLAIELLEK